MGCEGTVWNPYVGSGHASVGAPCARGRIYIRTCPECYFHNSTITFFPTGGRSASLAVLLLADSVVSVIIADARKDSYAFGSFCFI